MSVIFITGHRNPDMDSVCSAFAYARLKNAIDPDNTYYPVRCGHLSGTVKKQLSLLGIKPPEYKRDVYPKVSDVMLEVRDRLQLSSPIYDLIRVYDPSKPSVVPVYDGKHFFGLLSIDDINAWFLSESAMHCPEYEFTEQNIVTVTDSTVLKTGTGSVFKACVITGGFVEEYFKTESVSEDKKPVVVMSYNQEYFRNAVKHNVPVIILAGSSETPKDLDYAGYSGSILLTAHDTAETLRRVRMAPAVSTILGRQGKNLQTTDLFDDARDALLDSKLRGLSVFEGENWVGFVTRRCFLKKPCFDVILVDHNEIGQSIRGIEKARVREIIDHHRLDALKTDLPIFIDSEPLGSTCTIVYSQFQRHNIVPDEETARALLAGIISDTLILRSPTTTTADKAAAGALAAICGEYDINAFGSKLFSVTETLASVDPETAIKSDFKRYEEDRIKIGIGQYETTTLKNVKEFVPAYSAALSKIADSNGLDWIMLMVTDVLREKSILIAPENKLNAKLPYSRLADDLYDMPGVLSRKKQLLPEVLHSLE